MAVTRKDVMAGNFVCHIPPCRLPLSMCRCVTLEGHNPEPMDGFPGAHVIFCGYDYCSTL